MSSAHLKVQSELEDLRSLRGLIQSWVVRRGKVDVQQADLRNYYRTLSDQSETLGRMLNEPDKGGHE
jgi:hypothetical protein